jgi:hypothetical protein
MIRSFDGGRTFVRPAQIVTHIDETGIRDFTGDLTFDGQAGAARLVRSRPSTSRTRPNWCRCDGRDRARLVEWADSVGYAPGTKRAGEG